MSFNYNQIPDGFYDKIFEDKDGVRKFWHWHKFDSVIRCLNLSNKMKLLDIGCFSGSFIGRFVGANMEAVGVDILPSQIEYAHKRYESEKKKFIHIHDFDDAVSKLKNQSFDVVTFIEVIEHLNQDQIRAFFNLLEKVTTKGSQIVITTPNYVSMWPILEIILNHCSDVTYEEQHITKFNYFNIIPKLQKITSNLSDKYEVEIKATSHFITPLVAKFDYQSAVKLSSKIIPTEWHNPFGCIVILKLIKK